MLNLGSKIGDIELKTPLILASGILDQTSDTMKRVSKKNLGGIVTKSIGKTPREGHPNPTIVELDHGLLNAMGLPNPGIDVFLRELRKADFKNKVLIGSIFADNEKDFTILASKMEGGGADAVELNLSCPHAKGYGASIGSDPKLVSKVVKRVKKEVEIPVFAKLPPLGDIVGSSISAEKAGADAIVAINTLKSIAINYEMKKPILGNKIGGYSGPGIKPVGLRCVYEIYQNIDIPVIGVGGISTGRDALEYVLAGASALQIGSVFYYRGIDAGEKITTEIQDLMEKEGYENLYNLIGEANEE